MILRNFPSSSSLRSASSAVQTTLVLGLAVLVLLWAVDPDPSASQPNVGVAGFSVTATAKIGHNLRTTRNIGSIAAATRTATKIRNIRSIGTSQSIGIALRAVTTTNTEEAAATSSSATRTKSKFLDAPLLLQELGLCQTGTAARTILERALFPNNHNNNSNIEEELLVPPLFASMTIPRGLSDQILSESDLAIQTRMASSRYSIFDVIDNSGNRDIDRASAAIFVTFVGSSFSAIAAQENLPGPEIVRFIVVWLLTFAPFVLVGYGLSGATEQLAAVLIQIQRTLFPSYRTRMVQHEAGHLLASYLLGIPIQGYATNARSACVQFYPFNDPDSGRNKAQQLGFDRPTTSDTEEESVPIYIDEKPYFSENGAGADIVSTQSVFRNVKNYTENPFLKLTTTVEPRQNPKQSWPYRGFTHDMIDKLCIVSVAGVCAEIMAFGNAEGGNADFVQLEQLFATAEPELSERDKENRIRFAMGYTMSQLRMHLGCLDDLAAVMDRGGTIAECVVAIEQCTDVTGNKYGVIQDYELERRKVFQSSAKNRNLGLFERFLLGDKNVDDTDGTNRETNENGGVFNTGIHITGDDPVYLALGLAFIFLYWAANGGLSLH